MRAKPFSRRRRTVPQRPVSAAAPSGVSVAALAVRDQRETVSLSLSLSPPTPVWPLRILRRGGKARDHIRAGPLLLRPRLDTQREISILERWNGALWGICCTYVLCTSSSTYIDLDIEERFSLHTSLAKEHTNYYIVLRTGWP